MLFFRCVVLTLTLAVVFLVSRQFLLPQTLMATEVHDNSQQDAVYDLISVLENPPLGLPPIPLHENSSIDAEKAALGRKLFTDKRLSFNNTLSCAMCHIPRQGFTNNELAVPVGFQGRSGRRNAPSLYNVAYIEKLFHDGRETSLETLIFGPLTDRAEMANPSIGYVLEKIRTLSDYEGLFEQAFDGRSLSLDTLGMAFATYLRLLVSGNSPFDRWYYGKQENAIDDQAKLGFRLFKGKAGCIACHTVKKKYALFTDNKFHNTGLGWYNTFRPKPDKRRVQLAPGVYINADQHHIDAVRQQQRPNDLGRHEVTKDPDDRWAFRTPTLRNIVLTAPYMHDGSLKTLEEVIEFYNQGGHDHELLSPLIRPLNLSRKEQKALVTFMHMLTGDNVEAITTDAHAAASSELHKLEPENSQ